MQHWPGPLGEQAKAGAFYQDALVFQHGTSALSRLVGSTRTAYSGTFTPPTGRTLSGGLDSSALHWPKRFLGAARNIRDGSMELFAAKAVIQASGGAGQCFKPTTNALICTGDGIAQALPRLPEEVRQIGVTAVKSSPDLTMVVHLLSPDGRYAAIGGGERADGALAGAGGAFAIPVAGFELSPASTYRPTVSRCIPSSRAMRRRDQPRSCNASIACISAILS